MTSCSGELRPLSEAAHQVDTCARRTLGGKPRAAWPRRAGRSRGTAACGEERGRGASEKGPGGLLTRKPNPRARAWFRVCLKPSRCLYLATPHSELFLGAHTFQTTYSYTALLTNGNLSAASPGAPGSGQGRIWWESCRRLRRQISNRNTGPSGGQLRPFPPSGGFCGCISGLVGSDLSSLVVAVLRVLGVAIPRGRSPTHRSVICRQVKKGLSFSTLLPLPAAGAGST